jgi:RNA polymerase sigma-70 factor (ECF subfamily)
MHTTPPSLLERLRDPSERTAWDRFVDLYAPMLFAWARRLDLDGHSAADFVQDVFTALVEKMPQFVYDTQGSFRSYLRATLQNRWRNFLARRKTERTVHHPSLESIPESRDQVPELDEAEYRQHLVSRALAIMKAEFEPKTWKACWEFVVTGRSAEEVARELEISVNSVYLAKSRVLRRLREELSGLLS